MLCLDDLSTGAESNIAHLMSHPKFRLQRQDVTRYIDVAGPVDYVLHFAAPASPVDYVGVETRALEIAALGTHNSLGLALAKRAKYLLASSAEFYGDPQVQPTPENYWGHVNPVGPRGVYGEARRFPEALTMAYHRYHGLDTRIARIFNTYGPRMRLNDGCAPSNFFAQALSNRPLEIHGEGKQVRSFCYVSDMTEGIYRLTINEEHEPVNLGDPQGIEVMGLAKGILAVTGASSEIIFKPLLRDDPKERCPDISKARRQLNWGPKVNLEDGLRLTFEHFRQQAQHTAAK